MWWSDVIVEELGNDREVDISVGTHGDSGLITQENTCIDKLADTGVHTSQDREVHIVGDIGVITLEDIGTLLVIECTVLTSLLLQNLKKKTMLK